MGPWPLALLPLSSRSPSPTAVTAPREGYGELGSAPGTGFLRTASGLTLCVAPNASAPPTAGALTFRGPAPNPGRLKAAALIVRGPPGVEPVGVPSPRFVCDEAGEICRGRGNGATVSGAKIDAAGAGDGKGLDGVGDVEDGGGGTGDTAVLLGERGGDDEG